MDQMVGGSHMTSSVDKNANSLGVTGIQSCSILYLVWSACVSCVSCASLRFQHLLYLEYITAGIVQSYV